MPFAFVYWKAHSFVFRLSLSRPRRCPPFPLRGCSLRCFTSCFLRCVNSLDQAVDSLALFWSPRALEFIPSRLCLSLSLFPSGGAKEERGFGKCFTDLKGCLADGVMYTHVEDANAFAHCLHCLMPLCHSSFVASSFTARFASPSVSLAFGSAHASLPQSLSAPPSLFAGLVRHTCHHASSGIHCERQAGVHAQEG